MDTIEPSQRLSHSMTRQETPEEQELELIETTRQGNNPIVPQELKPADRGRDAWTVLIAGFVFEALFWGFPMSFGVFQNYYSSLPQFSQDADNIPLIGTLAQGLFYLGAPFSALCAKRFPRFQRQQIWLGWPTCILSLLAASFCSTVPSLVLTQGLMYGLGFVTLTFPIISMVNEWWVARKGMALGLLLASAGITGAALPFLLEHLLATRGHAFTLRACAVALAVLTGPILPLFKGRLPASRRAELAATDWSFLRRPLFWIYCAAILAQGAGFFYPVTFLPSYATSIGAPPVQGAVLVALMSVAQVLGQFAFGYLSDRQSMSVSLLSGICCFVAAAASLALWGPAKGMALLVVFSLVYGFFGFGFGTMRVGMGRAVMSGGGDGSTLFTTYAIFVFLQGVGNVLVGPISAVLLAGKESAVDKYGAGRYSGMVILTAATSFFAAALIGGWHGYKGLAKFIDT